MDKNSFDSFAPAQMAKRAQESAIRKANRDFISALFLAIQAGSFIAFGAAFFTLVIHDSPMGLGLTKLVGGMVFSLGLILVIVAGADLFTGDTMMVMGSYSKKFSIAKMLRGWLFVYVGNFLGSMSILMLIYFSGHWMMHGGAVGAKALAIANGKVNLGFLQAFTSGILCNVLVCLAIWLCYSGRSVIDKILSIVFPITAFVAMGFEHSIANMYFIPAGLILKHNPKVVALLPGMDLSHLTIQGFLLNNLLPVTLGNIVGGAVFVGSIYWILYLREKEA